MDDLSAAFGDPAITVHRYFNAFNRADADAMAACFAPEGHILDGMAPHVWSGPTAARDWWWAVLLEAGHLGLTDFVATLGEPIHNAVTGTAAYLVMPATMTFKARGVQIRQSGAMFTVGLTRASGDWLITAWAWTKGIGGGTGDVARPPS